MAIKIPEAWPIGMRTPVAEAYVGGRSNLETLVERFELKPVVQGRRNTTYDKRCVDAAWNRALALEWRGDDSDAVRVGIGG